MTETAPTRTRVPADVDLLRLGHENFIEAFRAVARALPAGRIEEDRERVCIASGIPGPEFNPVFLRPAASDPYRAIQKAREFMEGVKVTSWRLVALPGGTSNPSQAAEAVGLLPSGGLPGMLLSPFPSHSPTVPRGVRILAAHDPEVWNTMVRIGLTGFGTVAPDDVDTFLPFDGHRTVRGYVAYLKNRPLGTSMAMDFGSITGVYFVSVLPEARGKGVGGALTMRAALDGREKGCLASYLQSSDMGFNLYRKLGFRHLATYNVWIKGDTTEESA